MCTIRVFRGLANQVAPRAGSVLRGRLKVHNSKSGTCQGGVFLVYCMMYFIILIYLIILQLSRGASGKEFFGARTHGFCTHQARPTCKNTGKVNNRSRETGTHGRYCTPCQGFTATCPKWVIFRKSPDAKLELPGSEVAESSGRVKWHRF